LKVGQESHKDVIACILIANHFNLRAESAGFFGNDGANAVHGGFVV
jgi:hypothetical protein